MIPHPHCKPSPIFQDGNGTAPVLLTCRWDGINFSGTLNPNVDVSAVMDWTISIPGKVLPRHVNVSGNNWTAGGPYSFDAGDLAQLNALLNDGRIVPTNSVEVQNV